MKEPVGAQQHERAAKYHFVYTSRGLLATSIDSGIVSCEVYWYVRTMLVPGKHDFIFTEEGVFSKMLHLCLLFAASDLKVTCEVALLSCIMPLCISSN